MKFKRVLSLVIGASLAFSLALVPMQHSRAAEKTKISFWHGWTGDEAKKLKGYIDEFNASQDEVEVDVLDSQSRDALLTALTGSDGPDMVYNMDFMANQWGNAGLLRPLNDLIESSGMDLENSVKSEIDIVTVDDNIYGIPYTMDIFALFYNKKILAEHGFEAPKTLEEMFEQCKAIATKEGDSYTRLGYVPDFPWIEASLMAHKYGAYLWDSEKKELGMPSEAWEEYLAYKDQYYSEFGRDEVTKFKSGFGAYDSPENPFFQGKVAFAIEGEWYPTFIKDYAPADFEWGVVPLPGSEKHPEFADVAETSAGMLMINGKSEKAEACFKFISWLKEDQHYLDFCIAKGSLPSSYTAMRSERIDKEAPELRPFIDVVLNGNPKSGPSVAFLSELVRQLRKAEESVFAGDQDPHEAYEVVAAELADQVEEVKSE
ncbi:MAG: extracellular solute-binding protein [Eubacteriales bacterium]|nr:extracellular solute-binding protein [Eubacteriales bacterium]